MVLSFISVIVAERKSVCRTRSVSVGPDECDRVIATRNRHLVRSAASASPVPVRVCRWPPTTVKHRAFNRCAAVPTIFVSHRMPSPPFTVTTASTSCLGDLFFIISAGAKKEESANSIDDRRVIGRVSVERVGDRSHANSSRVWSNRTSYTREDVAARPRSQR